MKKSFYSLLPAALVLLSSTATPVNAYGIDVINSDLLEQRQLSVPRCAFAPLLMGSGSDNGVLMTALPDISQLSSKLYDGIAMVMSALWMQEEPQESGDKKKSGGPAKAKESSDSTQQPPPSKKGRGLRSRAPLGADDDGDDGDDGRPKKTKATDSVLDPTAIEKMKRRVAELRQQIAFTQRRIIGQNPAGDRLRAILIQRLRTELTRIETALRALGHSVEPQPSATDRMGDVLMRMILPTHSRGAAATRGTTAASTPTVALPQRSMMVIPPPPFEQAAAAAAALTQTPPPRDNGNGNDVQGDGAPSTVNDDSDSRTFVRVPTPNEDDEYDFAEDTDGNFLKRFTKPSDSDESENGDKDGNEEGDSE